MVKQEVVTNRKEIEPIGSGDPGDLNHKEPSLLVGRELPYGLQRKAGEQFSSNIHFPLLSCAKLGTKHGSWGLSIHSNRETMGPVKREVGHSGKLYNAVSRLHLCEMGWSPVRAGSCSGIQDQRQLWLRELERCIADQMSDTSTDSD